MHDEGKACSWTKSEFIFSLVEGRKKIFKICICAALDLSSPLQVFEMLW